MVDKAARFTILIDADRKKAFDALCAASDVTTSEMIRQLIEAYLERHDAQEAAAPAPAARPRRARG